jgi:LysR family transcriptional activator of dmlA
MAMQTPMDGFSDLAFFALVAKCGSLAGAAQELGITPPAASKRLAALERRLGVRLMQRTTRRLSLTPEGETYLVDGARVLEDLEQLERTVAGSRAVPQGLLRVSATLGFGRRHIAPALSQFVRLHPEVEVQLHLTDRPVNLVEQGFDLRVHFGDLPDARLTTRLLAHNHRVLCAAPQYLQSAGEPATPHDLSRHACLFIREGDETFGTWHLRSANGTRHETVKVRGRLSSNDGESAIGWALDGHAGGAAGLAPAAGRHPRRLRHAQPPGGQDAGADRLSGGAIRAAPGGQPGHHSALLALIRSPRTTAPRNPRTPAPAPPAGAAAGRPRRCRHPA